MTTVASIPALAALVLPPHWYPSWWRAPAATRIYQPTVLRRPGRALLLPWGVRIGGFR